MSPSLSDCLNAFSAECANFDHLRSSIERARDEGNMLFAHRGLPFLKHIFRSLILGDIRVAITDAKVRVIDLLLQSFRYVLGSNDFDDITGLLRRVAQTIGPSSVADAKLRGHRSFIISSGGDYARKIHLIHMPRFG